MTQEQLILAAIALLAGIAYIFYATYRLAISTPPERAAREKQWFASIDKEVERAEVVANETSNPMDNDFLEAFKYFYTMYKAGRFQTPTAAPTVTTTTTTTEPLYDPAQADR